MLDSTIISTFSLSSREIKTRNSPPIVEKSVRFFNKTELLQAKMGHIRWKDSSSYRRFMSSGPLSKKFGKPIRNVY